MQESIKNKSAIIMIVIALFAGGVGFFGGMKYQQSKRAPLANQFGLGARPSGASGGNMQRQNSAGATGGQAMGEITAQDEKSITVKLQDGSSKIVFFSDSTSINKATAGSKDDLKVGEKVGVFGTSNSDGSITAQSIELNPTVKGAFTDGQVPKQ